MEPSHEATTRTRVVRAIAMTPEANELLTGLARETGLSEGDVLRLALGLFKVASEARRRGQHVGIASTPEALDLEFVGFLGALEEA